MAGEEKSRRRKSREELEKEILGKVGEIISVIKEAKQVDGIICALHSLSLLLFPLDSSLFAGSLEQNYRKQVLEARIPSDSEREDWWQAFYYGAAFPTLARILLYNVASNWLLCFPISARTHVYDSFFINGPATETVQALVPVLLKNGTKQDFDPTSVSSNAERLLVVYLLDNKGVCRMAKECCNLCKSEECANKYLKPDKSNFISKMAQLIASIPDKARPQAPPALSSHLFFKHVNIQLLEGAQERAMDLCNEMDAADRTLMDGTLLFVGETFARICRRGSADILLVEIIPQILEQVRSFLSSSCPDEIEARPEFHLWRKIMETIKDPYAVERFSEELLRQLATEQVTDAEAYWILWIIYNRTFKHQTLTRAMFTEKFLLWKVFPLCSLRWILQFSVFECPPSCTSASMKGQNTGGSLGTVQRLIGIWSKREFVQSASIEQQAYVTAAVGLSLEKMSKEELEATKDIMQSLLHGISCRLESPIHLVRKMASCVALALSKVIDPSNPLYLDDICKEETVEWDFGLTTLKRRVLAASTIKETLKDEVNTSSYIQKEVSGPPEQRRNKGVKGKISSGDRELLEFRLVDPDEVIDPATLNNDYSDDDEDDAESSNSETLSDSSLQPYDLSDDDADLKRKFSQLNDIVSALRKSDDPDGVEGALDAAEMLIRASPNELQYVSGDLAKTLVHVRCSDATIEGEEDSAEEKRQRALVALLVTCPFESLDSLTKLLYSATMDVSQRILILDVMTDAAQELADAKSMRVKHLQTGLISAVSGSQPWFLPSNRGPSGAGPWKEVSETGTVLSFSHCYERDLPSKPSQVKCGKSRRWSLRPAKMHENQLEWSKNKFPMYAAAFMLPVMKEYDKKRHGVDLLGRDFIVLGKLIYMLGVCMKCMALHPEASVLAPPLLDLLSSREITHHVEAYVRRSVLFAASSILLALHPSYVASALVEGNQAISEGLEWIRTLALRVAETDSDAECSTMAMMCLQLHAEMALQASRSLESADPTKARNSSLSYMTKRRIMIPPTI